MERMTRITGHLAPVISLESKRAEGTGHTPPSGLAPCTACEAHGATPPGSGAKIYQLPVPQKFRYNDVHFHPTNYHNQGLDYASTLGMMDKLGIKHTVMAPIPTIQVVRDNLGREYRPAHGKACCGCNYYIPDDRIRNARHVSGSDYRRVVAESPPLAYDTACDSDNAKAYLKLKPADRERFDPMVTGLILGTANAADRLLRTMDNHPGVFTGVGEITVHKEFVQDKLHPAVQANVVPGVDRNIEGLVGLIQTCGDIGMPMVIHCDADVIPDFRDPEAEPLYFDHMKNVFAMPECRNTKIIWAHAAGAGKYAHLRDDHVDRLDAMPKDSELKHVNIDISWDVVADQICNKPEPDGKGGTKYVFDHAKAEKWLKLFETHADRIVFGSDSLAPLSHENWDETATQYKEMLARLSPTTRDKIMSGNYERLIVDARPRVRAWERHCLPHVMPAVNVRNDPVKNIIKFTEVTAKSERALLYARVTVELDLAKGNDRHPKVQKALNAVMHGVKSAELAKGTPADKAEAAGWTARAFALAHAHEAILQSDTKERMVARNRL